MESLERATDIETRRMELRGIVHLAGEVIAQYWPMRTFVHHNPLHSLEYLPFEETVRRGKQFMGGNGYLPSYQYREYYAAGRIRHEDLDAALKSLARESQVLIGSRKLTHAEVLRACLIEGLCDPVVEPLDSELPDDSGDLIDSLAKKLSLVMPMRDLSKRIDAIVQGDVADLGRWLTLSHWCDDTLGTEIVRQINDQLIKWCEAFLDEGHATWAMPDREKGMYQAWKTIAAHEWSPCGIADSGRKISQLPDYPEDALLESLDALGIPSDLRQDYLSLQLTALPGWAGFIKWRGEERDYPWQQAYPAGLVKFLAIRSLVRPRTGRNRRAGTHSVSRDAMMRSSPTCGTIPRNTICDVSGWRGDCRRCTRRRWIGWRIREAMGGVRCFSAIGRTWFPANRRPQDVAWPRDLWRWHGRLTLIRRA